MCIFFTVEIAKDTNKLTNNENKRERKKEKRKRAKPNIQTKINNTKTQQPQNKQTTTNKNNKQNKQTNKQTKNPTTKTKSTRKKHVCIARNYELSNFASLWSGERGGVGRGDSITAPDRPFPYYPMPSGMRSISQHSCCTCLVHTCNHLHEGKLTYRSGDVYRTPV